MTAPLTVVRRFTAIVGLVALLVAAGCGDSGDARQSGGPTSVSVPPDVRGLDFVAGSESDLGGGWKVAPCESGPPLFCARHDGKTRATIELLSVPATSYPAVKKVLGDGGSPDEALRAQASEYQRTFVADRPLGCGGGYTVEAFGPKPATVAGRPGVLYGFDGKHNGRHVERALQFATIDNGTTLHLISTNAVEDGTCMDDGELSEFTVSELTAIQPALVRAVAAGTLP